MGLGAALGDGVGDTVGDVEALGDVCAAVGEGDEPVDGCEAAEVGDELVGGDEVVRPPVAPRSGTAPATTGAIPDGRPSWAVMGGAVELKVEELGLRDEWTANIGAVISRISPSAARRGIGRE